MHIVPHLQNEFEPVGAFQALSSWQVANNLCSGRILKAQMNFIPVFDQVHSPVDSQEGSWSWWDSGKERKQTHWQTRPMTPQSINIQSWESLPCFPAPRQTDWTRLRWIRIHGWWQRLPANQCGEVSRLWRWQSQGSGLRRHFKLYVTCTFHSNVVWKLSRQFAF